MKKIVFTSLILIFILTGCGMSSRGISGTENFKKPNIKDQFCGIEISFQYCKCAFHNEYCDSIGMSKGGANKYVREQYDNWIEMLRQDFTSRCENANGFMSNNTCNYDTHSDRKTFWL